MGPLCFLGYWSWFSEQAEVLGRSTQGHMRIALPLRGRLQSGTGYPPGIKCQFYGGRRSRRSGLFSVTETKHTLSISLECIY